jgi:hypothetical protein
MNVTKRKARVRAVFIGIGFGANVEKDYGLQIADYRLQITDYRLRCPFLK